MLSKIERDMQLRDILEYTREKPGCLEKVQIEKTHSEVDHDINAFLAGRR